MNTDVFSTEKRAEVMRAVKGKNTGPELRVRETLRALGYARRYRLGGGGLPGKPDIVFGRAHKAVFVHGCFWHGHDCKRGARAPKANADYWSAKIARNCARDKRVIEELAAKGWSALVVWECETREAAALSARLKSFLGAPASAPKIKASRTPAP